MKDSRTGKLVPDENVVFYDGFIYVISAMDCLERNVLNRRYSLDVILLCPEYDDPVSLVDIKNKYPFVCKVLHEDMLSGEVYNYGNHKRHAEEYWELTGETVGFA